MKTYEKERDVERECIRLYEGCGCVVVKFSQRRASRQTPGIPDLKIYAGNKRTWWHEVKTKTGVLSDAQIRLHEVIRSSGEAVVVGGVRAAEVALREHGVIR